MTGALQAFEELQPYLTSQERFGATASEAAIVSIVKSLREGFHSAQDIKGPLTRDPGFVANLSIIEDLLGDAERRFKEGKKGYALYRLRTVSSNCSSCHMTYSVTISRKSLHELPEGLNALEQAEYYLAARQFDKASEALTRAMEEGKSPLFTIEALRKWLMLEIRVKEQPQKTIDALLRFQQQVTLPHDEREEITQWIRSLRHWQGERPTNLSLVKRAKLLMEQSLRFSFEPVGGVDVVNLLRASAMLHRALTTPGLSDQDRSSALLLLGFCYYRLPLYFIDELPEVYFERCIQEFPGSKEAKQAYRYEKEKVILDFTGSSGTHIPADVVEHMNDLYKKAYGITQFEGAV
ncbi:MAG: hypothetical protein EBZ48_13395 [Proteobacteria bacterium]|nr:hypothetical protein [Pseudomonadota bacterium]